MLMPLSRLLSLTDVTVIAHRGGSKLRPENTMAAFDHAASLGVDALECDVHFSRDKELVVIHDPTLDRTTDATGPVAAMTADELSRVDAGAKFGADEGFPQRGIGLGVPRLSTLLRRHTDVPIVIEIKGEDPGVAEATLAMVREFGALERVIIGGFSDAVLRAVRRLAPAVPTGASSLEGRSAVRRSLFWIPPRRGAMQVFQLPFRLRGKQILSRTLVHGIRRRGWPVHAWIIDDPADMTRLIDWGVTGITTDRPDLALDLVARRARG